MVATFQKIQKSFESRNLRTEMDHLNLCPGVSETEVLPLLSHFVNVNFACIMFLVERVGEDVMYRSRKCELVTQKRGEDLGSSCKELFQSLKLEINNFVKEEAETDDGIEDFLNIELDFQAENDEKGNGMFKNDLKNIKEDSMDCEKKQMLESVEEDIEIRKKSPSTNKSSWICQVCGRIFGQKSTLHNHTKNMHDPPEFEPCHICGKIIKKNGNSIHSH